MAKINSKNKGNRGEREIVDFLNARFAEYFLSHPDIGKFSRSVGSGNRWGHGVSLSQAARDTYLGDLTCPEGFKFVIEVKLGYDSIDLCSLWTGRNKSLDSLLDQALEAGSQSGRQPLLIWRKNRKPWILFSRLATAADPCLTYRGWFGIGINQFFSGPDADYFS